MPDRDNPNGAATIETDLAAIDAALDAGHATSADQREREFQELALALESDSPSARPEFEHELGELVRAGFPRAARGGLPGTRTTLRRPRVGDRWRLRGTASARVRDALSGVATRAGRLPAPARRVFAPRRVRVAAGVATVLIAIGVAVSLQGERDGGVEGEAGGGDPKPLAADERAPAQGSGSAGDAASPSASLPPPQPPTDGDFAPGARQRRVERSASITLAADRDRLDGVADGISTVAGRQGGFVLRSSVTTGGDGTDGGTFELKVPVRNLPATLQDLDELGDVTSRTQSAEDVTAAFVSLSDELDAARAERRGLLHRLERADSDRAAEALRRRIELASARVNGLRRRVRALRERTAFAGIHVSLTARDGDSGSAGGGGANGTEDAARDALGSLLGAVNLLLRTLGVLIPLALVGILAWLAARGIRRRRREAALS